jgi:hypothetical protein
MILQPLSIIAVLKGNLAVMGSQKAKSFSICKEPAYEPAIPFEKPAPSEKVHGAQLP